MKTVAVEAKLNVPIGNSSLEANDLTITKIGTNPNLNKTRGSTMKKASSRRKMAFGHIPSRAAEHEAGNSFIEEYEKHGEALEMLSGIEGNNNFHNSRQDFSTEESSDALSSINSTISSEYGNYEVIEYDLSDPEGLFSSSVAHQEGGIHYLNLSPPTVRMKTKDSLQATPEGTSSSLPNFSFLIEDDSPAAAAVRANARIHVSTVGKAARAVHLQSIRRLAKFAAGANKTGYRKGKPPRIPPTSARRHADGPFGGPGRYLGSGSIDEEDYDEDLDENDEEEADGVEECYTGESLDDEEDGDNHRNNDRKEEANEVVLESNNNDVIDVKIERDGTLPYLGRKHHSESWCEDDATRSEQDPCTPLPPVPPLVQLQDDGNDLGNETILNSSEQKLKPPSHRKHMSIGSDVEELLLRQSLSTAPDPYRKYDMAAMKDVATSTAHFNDGVARGTIEAGKKGKYFRPNICFISAMTNMFHVPLV
jgi:hypothetical protein